MAAGAVFNGGVTRYRERLWPSVGLFLAISLLAPAGLLVFLPIGTTVGIVGAATLLAIGVAFLLLTTPTIEVTDTVLRAGRASLPLRYVGTAVAITGDEAVAARGTELDARAWLLLRGWLPDVVRIENTDAADPAPYWVVSSRHPDALVAALAAATSEAAPRD